MIITIICDVLGEKNNGTTIACINLIKSLKERGHNVRVVCPDSDKKGEPGWYVVPELNLGFINYFVHKNNVKLASPDKKILENAIRDCDLVHTTFVFDLSKTAITIAKRFGKPVTSSFHCQAENYTTHLGLQNMEFINRLVYKRYYRQIFRRADCVHFPTQFVRDIFEKVTAPVNGVVISNGVNDIFRNIPVPKPSCLENKFVILSVGRLSDEKNHSVLIRGIAKSKHRKDIHLIIAGEGPEKGKLYRLAHRYGVDMEIGFYPREKLVEIMNYSDLYVHPSKVEIEAISCLEAICCGLVPIVSDSPKAATRNYAITSKNIFESNNAQSLAERMDYWIEHPEEKKACSKEYLKAAIWFNQRKCMDQMEEMMVDTVRNHGHEKDGILH
ncbi:MAG: glycosyltransferase [Bacteroidales bacterium]|jgi:glycosyltransferase involved in cell wall biosynthesis|nr:glycosyltransferase [Bacteroidales bacterium]MCI2121405.1 glycosyltransferase [Bacteroidales bacterium]MCI2146233.1 glycosyltransferase [Bacteroidales bacterium]